MLGTAKWYCARCSEFIDDAQTACDSCGQVRGSARSHHGCDDQTFYWTCTVIPSVMEVVSSAGRG